MGITKKKQIILLFISIALVLAVVSTGIGISLANVQNRNGNNSGTQGMQNSPTLGGEFGFGAEYSMPEMGDPIAPPEPPNLAVEREWFEYIEYSRRAHATFHDSFFGNVEVFLPLDFANSSVMEVEPLQMLGGAEWSSANSVTVTFSRTVETLESNTRTLSGGTMLENKTEVKARFFGLSVKNTTTLQIRADFKNVWHNQIAITESQTITRTFNMIPSPAGGTIWRVAQYTVFIPIKFVTDVGTFYFLSIGSSGLIRQWQDGFYEHWMTGQPVSQANFLTGFVTRQQLIDTFRNAAPLN